MKGELQDKDSDGEEELVQARLPTAGNDDNDDARNGDMESPLHCNTGASYPHENENAALGDTARSPAMSNHPTEVQHKEKQQRQILVPGFGVEADQKTRSSPSLDDVAKNLGEEKSQKLRSPPDQKQTAIESHIAEPREHGELERNPTTVNKNQKGKTQPAGTLRFFRPKGSSREGPTTATALPVLVPASANGQDPSALSEPGAIAVFPSTDFIANGTAPNTDEHRLVPTLEASQHHFIEPQNEAQDNTGLAVANLVDENIPTRANAVDALQFAERARKARQYRTLGFCAIFVAFVALVASVVGTQYKSISSRAVTSASPSSVPSFSPSPSSVPSFSPTLSREAYLQSLLPEFLSPQPLALEWSILDPFFESRFDWQILQRYSLAAFYYATNGDHWLDNTNWLSYNHSVCEWFNHNTEYLEEVDYVLPNSSVSLCPRHNDTALYQEIEEDGRVGEIYLGINNLKGTLPDELYLLTDLQLVDVIGNQLEGTLSTRIHQLQNLTLLSLAANNFYGTLPSEVGLVSSLGFLHLVSNTMEGTIPTEIGLLEKMDWLLLDDNEFTGLLPSELGLLTQMEILYTDRNNFNSSIPSELGMCSHLIELQMQESRGLRVGGLHGMIPTELGLLKKMQKLRLFNNMLTSAIPSELGQLSLLENLMLHTLSLTGTIPTEIGLLGKLTSLWLNTNHLSGTIPSELGLLSSLQHFVLADASLTGSLPSELGLLSNMTTMIVGHNQINGTLPASFGNLSMLQYLWASSTQMTGPLPSELGLLALLQGSLMLQENLFSGTIPREWSALLHEQENSYPVVNVTSNALLSGTVPSQLCSVSAFDCTSLLCGCSCLCT